MQLEKLHMETVAGLGLQGLRLAPQSCRHGGPSEDAAAGLRFAAEIQKRGRWELSKSVDRCMKPGTLLRQLNLLPAVLVTQHSNVLAPLPEALRPQLWSRTRATTPNGSIARR